MHMPDAIPENMFASCGMNCMVCYKHCTVCKSVRPCAGCLNGDEGKPRHCRACAIRDCCREKGLRYCLECTAFPCRRLNLRRIHGRAGIEACAARGRSRKKEPFRCALFVLYSFCGCKRIGAQRCRDARRTRQDPRSRRRNEIETEK